MLLITGSVPVSAAIVKPAAELMQAFVWCCSPPAYFRLMD